MNLPNKLTVLRVLLIPVFLVCFFLAYYAVWSWGYALSLLVFAGASVTDWVDGKIARARGLVTDFGKLMDPLADKLLVMSAMISFIAVGMVHPVVVIVILAREFLVTSIRMVAASGGRVIAADKWGKLKTVFQMTWICYGLFLLSLPGLGAFETAAMWVYYILVAIVVVLTVVSGVNYAWKSRDLFADM